MESNKPQTLMLLGIHLLLVFALSAHGHAASDHDNVIDLLAALNMSSHVSGVIRLQSPSGVVYRIRPRAPHLTLPPEYSQFLHSNFQGCMGVHFAGNQSTGSGGTLLSLSSLSSPILQIISSTLNKSLRVDYQAGGGGGRAQGLASLLFPKRNPFSWENWVQLAVSLEPDRLVFFVDCQEPIVVPIKSEERFNLELPQNVVITLASTPRRKVSKFSGHLKTAEISMKAYLRRPWLCDNITDILPPSQCSDVKKSGSQIDSSQTFKPDAPDTKTQTSHHQQDVQSDQLQRGVVLGPPATPQGVKTVSQSDDRLKKLEERIEELARMLDMVKAQNVGLQSRINYLEGCECVRGQCEWQGREVDEGQSWQIDLSTICTCTSGKVTCQPNIKGCDVDGTIHNVSHSTDGSNCKGGNRECTPQPCPSLDCTQTETVSGECCQQCRGCIHSGVRYDHKAEWRSEDNPCDICYCLEGNVRCTTETCLTPCNNPVAPAPNTCCPICEGCGVNGHEFPNGAVIPTEDSCQECICVNGNVVCSALSCPSLSCHNPVQSAGDCCPRCEQCEYESKVYMDGQKFTSQRDPCLLCRCSAGEVSCERIDASCPPLACTHPAQRRGQCCPTCDLCEYDRRVYADGKVFRPAGSGPCLQCRCKGGNVICHEERCPPAQCSRPVIDPQRCCPICKVCVSEGVEYEEGSSWHLEEPCSSCTCVNGEALCTHKQCPPHDCLHPTKTTGSCCTTCDSCTYNRRIYSNGQRFTTPEQPCHICTCQHGTVKCERKPCPSLSCANSYTPPGECCPKCPDCSFENHVFVDGEAFPNPVNSCEECKCVSGKIDCVQPQCPQPHCNSPRPGRCCQNNCNGCSYAGKEYPNGMDFPHPTDTCRTCSCINGNVQCLMKRCPPLQCSNPNLVSGECCPQCPAPPSDCMYEQRPYRHAERFYHPTDHCRSCVCTNGTVQCQRRPCPFAACSHPIKQDCCPTCEGCLYEGRERANGESWDVASDPCAVCMCRDGSVHCERKRCPSVSCNNPVQRQCCMSCDGCMYHGKEYADSTEFADDNDPCGACYCYGGDVICSKIQCYEECSHPYKPPGQCCGECERCYHNSVVLINGQSVPDPGNPCSECTCQSGSVHCVRKPCPAVHCPHPVTNPCGCPVCDGCQFQGVTYVDGQTVPGRERGCKDCTCSRGEVVCTQRRCPTVSCTHPALDGCECGVCDGCNFNGRDCFNGERFPHPTDHCQHCTCVYQMSKSTCLYWIDCYYNSVVLTNGQSVPDPGNPCSECTCQSGSVHCVRKPCPAVHCPHPVTNPCGCPVCDGCQFQGVTYVDGQTVPGGGNGCQDCTCSRGEVVCTQRRCPSVSCTHPALDGCECGVCDGCNFNGRDCFNGEQFPHPTDHCQHCTCVSGSVHCVRKPCPAVHCPHPVTNPCGCPVCDGCQFQGVTYVDGQTVLGRERECKDCTCSRGEVVCTQRRCPTVSCTHPALDGCECGVCDGCNFNGRDCFNGERFPHPTDHCQRCTCVDQMSKSTCLYWIDCYYNSVVLTNGQLIPDPGNPCSECTCQSGSVHCVRKSCPAVHCPHPVTNPCGCPVCDGCQFQGVTYVDGQTVPGGGNGCQDCTCSRGEVVCTQRRCPSVSCTHPALDGCECGVCDGCNFNGRDCFNGEQFPHPTDHCQHCTCVSGSVHCVRKPCPAVHCPHPVTNPCGCPVCDGCQFQGVTYVDGQTVPGGGNGCQDCTCLAGEMLCDSECTELQCMHQVTDPGACCPRCRGCMYEGEEHTEGSNWFADSAPCMSCMCVEGVTTCSEVHCLSPCVNFINVPGECCPMCADCIFEGRVYGPGDSFHPADDPCQICTCEVMPDGEQHLRCYKKQCPSLVDCPKSNILFSGPDSCCPVCAQPLSNCTSALIGNEVLATDDPCFTCSCQDLTWTCLHQMCQPPSCPLSEQFMPPDSCCPVCKDCVIEGQKSVANGSIWTDSDDDCVTCTCNLGHIECSIEECRPVVCADGQKPVKLPGKCCSECPVQSGGACLYHGTEYHCNEQWKLDECTTCTCVSGDVHCHHERCPPLTCATDEMPAVIPGLCCPHCLPRPATCIAFGDPHYRTFDGRMLHFQGACTYVLAQDCDNGDFSIHVTNDDRGRKGVSWTKEVTVYIGDVTVQLLQDWVVKVNNDVVELPFLQEPYIYIERQTNTILLNTNIGLKVLWSGRSHLEVSVPGSYKGQICGLCGNFNGYYHDDLRMASGGISLSEADFGNSWRVTNGSHYSSSCRPGEDVDPCKDAGYQAKKGANARCRVLKSAAFKPCHRVVPPEPWYGACVYDLCACGASSDECLCDALEAYASQCREAGVILQWRSPSLCAVGCPLERGFVFDECGPPCPKTCFNVDVPLGVIESHCFKPCVPGCQCPAGLVLHNNYCIQPEKCPKIIHDKDT